MYIRIATGRDSLDGPAMTKEIFAHASRSKRINHAKMDVSLLPIFRTKSSKYIIIAA